MQMLSEDDLNIKEMSDAELEATWELWFDLAQATNDFDPAYTHGVFYRKHRGRSRKEQARTERNAVVLDKRSTEFTMLLRLGECG